MLRPGHGPARSPAVVSKPGRWPGSRSARTRRWRSPLPTIRADPHTGISTLGRTVSDSTVGAMRRLDVRRGGQGETAGFLPVFLPGWRSVATVGSGLMQLKSVPGRLGAAPSVREAEATTTDRAQPVWPEHGPRAAGRRRKITNGRHRSAAKEQEERVPNGNHA